LQIFVRRYECVRSAPGAAPVAAIPKKKSHMLQFEAFLARQRLTEPGNLVEELHA
jgi:hypothetical protein